ELRLGHAGEVFGRGAEAADAGVRVVPVRQQLRGGGPATVLQLLQQFGVLGRLPGWVGGDAGQQVAGGQGGRGGQPLPQPDRLVHGDPVVLGCGGQAAGDEGADAVGGGQPGGAVGEQRGDGVCAEGAGAGVDGGAVHADGGEPVGQAHDPPQPGRGLVGDAQPGGVGLSGEDPGEQLLVGVVGGGGAGRGAGEPVGVAPVGPVGPLRRRPRVVHGQQHLQRAAVA